METKLKPFSYFSALSGHVRECQRTVVLVRRPPVERGLDCRVSVRRVPLLHLHGEAAERAPLPALLQALLLPLHPEVADGAAVAVPPLQGVAAHSRAGQLPLGGGGHAAAGHAEGGLRGRGGRVRRDGREAGGLARGQGQVQGSRGKALRLLLDVSAVHLSPGTNERQRANLVQIQSSSFDFSALYGAAPTLGTRSSP